MFTRPVRFPDLSLELDDKANVISYEEYYPYGSTAYQAVDKSIKAAAKRYRYTGKERDEETGLYYHGARYYVPWLGRWAATDRIGVKRRKIYDFYFKGDRPLPSILLPTRLINKKQQNEKNQTICQPN